MISGKSLTLLRAACSVTVGGCAVALGQESQQHLAASRHSLSPHSPLASYDVEGNPYNKRPLYAMPGRYRKKPVIDIGTQPSLDQADVRLSEAELDASTAIPVDPVTDVPSSTPTGNATSAVTAPDRRLPEGSSVANSVRFWAFLFKNLHGSSTASTREDNIFHGTVDGDDDDEEEKEPNCTCGNDIDRKKLWQGIAAKSPSPLNLKSATLNTVTASRHLFLVRHGQYYNNRKLERERCLTSLGREQLRLTGERLKELGISYSKLVASTMQRAQESAKIILKCLGNQDLPFESDRLLEEGAPAVPEPPLPHWRPDERKFQSDGARIEAAFLKYFRRPDTAMRQDANELIVCHANVIRYFICRALEVPPQAWLRMWLNHGSITWLTIKPSGRVVLNAMGASGYMPPSRLTAT